MRTPDESQILDKQPDKIVYTDYVIDELSNSDPHIPEKLPIAPSELSRFENYRHPNYTYPGMGYLALTLYLESIKRRCLSFSDSR
jgi:hypothetical protein